MQSFFEFFAGVDSVLSVLAAIAAVLLFGLAHRACAARIDPLATSFAVKVPKEKIPVLLARAVAFGAFS